MCDQCDCMPTIPSDGAFYIDKCPMEQCVICLDFIQEKNRSLLPCGHEFHATCLMENVVNGNNTCPLCRDEITKKTEEIPDLNATMVCRFVEETLSENKEINVLPALQEILKECHVNWSDLSYESKLNSYRIILHMCMGFGITMGESISKWIKEGNDRLSLEESGDTRVHVDLVSFMEEHCDDDDEEEEESFSIVPLFSEIEDLHDPMLEFLETFNLMHYSSRILADSHLSNLDNLLGADIETIMWPCMRNNRPAITSPLFSREEANAIMGGIIDYFSRAT